MTPIDYSDEPFCKVYVHGEGYFILAEEAALTVERAARQLDPPLWVEFDTIAGERVVCRTSLLEQFAYSTPESRALGQRFESDLKAGSQQFGTED